ncbi:MAG: Crp/Fnr family transcriptional regulator [Salibacteraceae bacterium]
MIETDDRVLFSTFYPQLAEAGLAEEIANRGTIMTVAEGEVILRKDAYVKVVPLVLNGLLKVLQEGEMHDTLMYYLEPGDSCIMSITACFNNEKSKVKAVVEDEARIIALPADLVIEWYTDFPAWNEFVTRLYRKRFLDLLDGFNSVVFDGIDTRLRNYLTQRARATGSNTLHATHKQIADDLGTAREVVSRLLKAMEVDGEVELKRGHLIWKG